MTRSGPARVTHHIGIVAHSLEGAAMCWTEIGRHSTRLGHPEHPDLTMDCISFERAMAAYGSGDLRAVSEILEVSVNRLAAAGSRFFVCPDNTAHLALEATTVELPLAGLHIVDVAADAAAERGFRRVGVLGTQLTMCGGLYHRELGRRGIDAVLPTTDERELVDAAIFADLVHGRVPDQVRDEFHRLVQRLRDVDRCDAVVAACTEVPLVLSTPRTALPVLDSTRLLAHAATEVALGRRDMPTWRGGPLPATRRHPAISAHPVGPTRRRPSTEQVRTAAPERLRRVTPVDDISQKGN